MSQTPTGDRPGDMPEPGADQDVSQQHEYVADPKDVSDARADAEVIAATERIRAERAGQTTPGEVPEREFTVYGGDWDELATEVEEDPFAAERLVINLGPQHPSTHGVLRLILEIEGEIVTQARANIGYLHTGIEKSAEYRTWTQGVTFVTRADYLTPMFNETAYCLAVEKLLGITDEIPERATVIRVIMMELQRISSHYVALATTGMELGALTAMTVGFRDRELILNELEHVTGLRMNNAYIRPGGVANDFPDDGVERIAALCTKLDRQIEDLEDLLIGNRIWRSRTQGIGYLDLTGCMALGITGPVLRATGLPWDLRKTMPYCGYENYDFEVQTADTADCWGRFLIRLGEMRESLKIIWQALEKLQPGPVMVDNPKIAWPAKLSIGPDGQGNSAEHIRHIMGESMESLIHHFKIVTEGFKVPAGQVYSSIESAKGELGFHMVSSGGTRPYRAHFREPSFINLQAIPAVCEGGMIADVIGSVASLDPVLGGVDR